MRSQQHKQIWNGNYSLQLQNTVREEPGHTYRNWLLLIFLVNVYKCIWIQISFQLLDMT